MKYKITIEVINEYEEKQTVYESKENGARYYSMHHKDITEGGIKVQPKEYPTGKIFTETREIYKQEFEKINILDIVKNINNIK